MDEWNDCVVLAVCIWWYLAFSELMYRYVIMVLCKLSVSAYGHVTYGRSMALHLLFMMVYIACNKAM